MNPEFVGSFRASGADFRSDCRDCSGELFISWEELLVSENWVVFCTLSCYCSRKGILRQVLFFVAVLWVKLKAEFALLRYLLHAEQLILSLLWHKSQLDQPNARRLQQQAASHRPQSRQLMAASLRHQTAEMYIKRLDILTWVHRDALRDTHSHTQTHPAWTWSRLFSVGEVSVLNPASAGY